MVVKQAGGVVLEGDQVLLRRTPKGEYLFPKGHIDPGETEEATARREVAEETGVEAEIVLPLGEISFSYQGDEYRVTMFLMRVVRQLPEWRQHLEEDTVVVDRSSVADLLSFDSYRQLWARAQAAM